jgi:hypothetical protein
MADAPAASNRRRKRGDQESASKSIPTRTTRPDYLPRHDISDEELEVFANTNRDGLSDRMWGAAGIAAGLLGPCLESLYKAYCENPRTPIDAFHLGEWLAFAGFTGVAATIYLLSGKREDRATAKIAEIRSRKTNE